MEKKYEIRGIFLKKIFQKKPPANTDGFMG